jgi:hypothetical protein
MASNRDLPIARALDAHRYRDAAGIMGQAAMDAGRVHTAFRARPANCSMLHQALVLPPDMLRKTGTTAAEAREAQERLESLLTQLPHARPADTQAAWALQEWTQALQLARHGCRRADALLTGTPDPALDRDLDDLIREQRRLWLRRFRTGGLADSLARFDRARLRRPYRSFGGGSGSPQCGQSSPG